MKSVKVASLTE